MHDAIAVEVLDSADQLPCDFFDSVFAQVEVPRLEIVEQICALHVLEHHEVVVGILKHV